MAAIIRENAIRVNQVPGHKLIRINGACQTEQASAIDGKIEEPGRAGSRPHDPAASPALRQLPALVERREAAHRRRHQEAVAFA
jgi:hypothetical protein